MGNKNDQQRYQSAYLENDKMWVSDLFQPFSYISGLSNVRSQGSACTYLIQQQKSKKNSKNIV